MPVLVPPGVPRRSLVIPVYKNRESLPDLMAACAELWRSCERDLEVVLVVDGSPDDCFTWLREHLPDQPFDSQLCLHSRNFGSFAAIRSGLDVARGDAIAVMAADLQEPTSLAQTFFEKLLAGEADIAIGVREGRTDPFFSALSSRVFWGLYRRFIISDVPEGGVDIFGCTRRVAQQLLGLRERNSSMIGHLFWVGYRRVAVPYVRQARKHGVSAWSFAKKVRYLFDSIYAFSDLPIRILKWIGGASALTALAVSVVVLAAKVVGAIDVPGYTAIILAVTFFGGLNAFGLGLLGEYVWRTFENTKARPLAITSERLEITGRGEQAEPHVVRSA